MKDTLPMLLEKIHTSTQELLQALEQTDFYVELLLSGISLVVCWLVARLIQGFARRRMAQLTRLHLTEEVLGRPFVLLTPLLFVLGLSSLKPLAEHFTEQLLVIPAAIEGALAYFAARLVLMLVKSRPVAWFITVVICAYALLGATGFMGSTAAYLQSMGFTLGKYNLTLLGLIQGIVIFVIVFWMAGASTRGLELYLSRISALSYSARELIKKFFTVLAYFLAFVITLGAVGVDLTALAVFGGALGVGIGLGLQKITSNFVSGVTILLEKSVKIGDLVEVGVNTGWVRQLHMRYVLIETSDGREVLIPNEELVSQRVTNWTYSNEHARIDVRVVIAYASDAVRAQALMLEAAKTHPLCLKTPEPLCWLREFGDKGLVFLLTFWIPDVKEGRYTPQSEVMYAILEKFRSNGIDIPHDPPAPVAI